MVGAYNTTTWPPQLQLIVGKENPSKMRLLMNWQSIDLIISQNSSYQVRGSNLILQQSLFVRIELIQILLLI